MPPAILLHSLDVVVFWPPSVSYEEEYAFLRCYLALRSRPLPPGILGCGVFVLVVFCRFSPSFSRAAYGVSVVSDE